MSEKAEFVGVDVAKATVDVACRLSAVKFRTRSKIANTSSGFAEFAQWLEQHANPDAWIVMEATGVYHEALAAFLHQRGYRVCVVNPAQMAAYAKSELSRTKTDRTDAKLIVRFAEGHRNSLRQWQPEAPAYRTLRAFVRRIEDLSQMRQMEVNRLETADPAVRPSIEKIIATFDEQIASARKTLHRHIDDDPDLRGRRDRLVTIPGIAETTAALLLAELGDTRRFDDVRAVVAFAGLNPALRQSGKYSGQVHISKIGPSLLRKGLYMPAVTALKYNGAVRALGLRLKERGKRPLVIVCAAMRKLLHIAFGVLKSGRPFDPKTPVA